MRMPVFFIPAAAAAVILQMHQAVGSPLKDDPVTTCTSYDLSDKNFPGRGTIIEDDGTCTITTPSVATTNRKLESFPSADIDALENHFGTKMERALKNLPTSLEYKPSPWVGPNWAYYLDGINYEWNEGQPSPAEKYATAFGLDVKLFMDKVSASAGIDANSAFPVCTSDDDCVDPNYVCAKRANHTSGYCLETWFGIGHAWAPASILEQEPRCPVTFNGVTFQPTDIKGLLTQVYDEANITTVFTGVRNDNHNDTVDQYGIHTSYAYRDLNPGYFHIAVTNLLGRLNSTFIVDRDASFVVSNQPVAAVKVLEQTPMTLKEASKSYYGLEQYPWNANASSIVYVKSCVSYINKVMFRDLLPSGPNSTDYTYLLELNEAEEIIGGQWLNESNDDHPDFLWFPTTKPQPDTVTSVGLSYANVTVLLGQAVTCSD